VDTINIVKITFDTTKSVANIKTRGLSFDRVADLDWSTADIVEDTRRDYGERRYRVIGYLDGRLHVAVFTPRGEAVHVISLRKANVREVKRYAET